MECPIHAQPLGNGHCFFPEGGLVPHVHLPGLHPTPRKSSEGGFLEAPALPGHWQDWVLLLPSGNPHHKTTGGKSEPPAKGSYPALCLLCVGPTSGFRTAGFQAGSSAAQEPVLVWLSCVPKSMPDCLNPSCNSLSMSSAV